MNNRLLFFCGEVIIFIAMNRRKSRTSKAVGKLLFLASLIWLGGNADVWGQAAKSEKKGEFISMGLVSVSREYTLADNSTFIVFKIKNNATRSIRNLFAWVYEYRESKSGTPSNFRLVNNPNRGGTLIEGDVHRPGTVAEWRFPLIGQDTVADSAKRFALRVSPSAVFFAQIEPKAKPEK